MDIPAKPDPAMSDQEWHTRMGLAALHHIIDALGWSDTINTHLSARVPGDPDYFLMSRWGRLYDEVTASSLVRLNMEGKNSRPERSLSKAGAALHSAVYRACPAANCVLHTHTRAGLGIALLPRGLRPISNVHLHVIDEVVYHPFGISGSPQEQEALQRSCAMGSCVVLQNHGLLTWGETIPGALMRLYMLDRACEVELIARGLDEPPVTIAEEVQRAAAERMKALRRMPSYGLDRWKALIRKADRRGFDWRR